MRVLRKEQIEARLVQSRQEKRRNATPEELKLLKNCLKEQQRYANEVMKLLYVQFDSLIIQVEYAETTISFTVKNTKCVDKYTLADSYFSLFPNNKDGSSLGDQLHELFSIPVWSHIDSAYQTVNG